MGKLLIFFTLLLLSFTFSGFETAFLSILKSEIAKIKSTFIRKLLNEFKKNELTTILTLLLSNTTVNTFSANIFSWLFSLWISKSHFPLKYAPLAEIFIFTLIILILGEITPKIISIRWPLTMSKILSPVVYPFFLFTKSITNLLPQKTLIANAPKKDEKLCVLDELEDLALRVDINLRSRISLLRIQAIHIMKPREKVTCINLHTTIGDFKKIVSKTRHTHYPVVMGNELMGVLNLNDPKIYSARDDDPVDWYLSQCPRVPSTLNALKILREFGEQDFIAVVDEYGNFVGIITPMDVLSKFFPELNVKWVSKNTLIVPGDILLSDLEAVIGKTLPFQSLTLQALIMEQTGRIPDEGETIDLKYIKCEIVEKDLAKIKKVKVEIP